MITSTLPLEKLRAAFPDRLQFDVPLARYTAALVGGDADALLAVNSVDELANAVEILWEDEIPFIVLGGGSNILVSDNGVRELVLLNRAKQVRFTMSGPAVWAGSGANFGSIARQAANKSLAGLEWAAGIPGTVGGAVFGNAGAHDGDMAGSLIETEVLIRGRGREIWPVERMEYAYRDSVLKQSQSKGSAVILSALLKLENGTPEAIREKMSTFLTHRRRTQPPGASMGSMFKNPSGDFSGRLIEATGLKGTRVGGAEISRLHANFFINAGAATANDVYTLIQLARETVHERFGVALELEIELIGDWILETSKN